MLAALSVVGMQGDETCRGIGKWVGRSRCSSWVCIADTAAVALVVAVAVAVVAPVAVVVALVKEVVVV